MSSCQHNQWFIIELVYTIVRLGTLIMSQNENQSPRTGHPKKGILDS